MNSSTVWLSLAVVALVVAVVAFYTIGWFVPPALAALGVVFALIGGIQAVRSRRQTA